MTGENFKALERGTKAKNLRAKVASLEKKKAKVWRDYLDWCDPDSNVFDRQYDYEGCLERLTYQIDEAKYQLYLLGV